MVSRILKENNIATNFNTPRTPLTVQKNIIDFYASGMSLKDTANAVGYSYTAVKNSLVYNGVKLKKSGPPPGEKNHYFGKGAANKNKENIIARYLAGETIIGIATIYGVSDSTVRYLLKRNNIVIRQKNACGENNPNWGGGKHNNPLYKLSKILRGRIQELFRKNRASGWKKNKKTHELIGAEWVIVRDHLESKFREGMTWENHTYNGWHIDHIIPLCSAKTEEELIKLFHYTNLQPLWAKENLRKSGKIVEVPSCQ